MSYLRTVKPRTLQRIDEQGPDQGDHSIGEIHHSVGPFEEFRTNLALSKMAGRALREIHGQKIDAKTRLANTATAIAETQMATAMIARAVPVISGSMERLNAQAHAGDQNYTAQEAVAIQSHFHARQSNRAEIERDARDGGLSQHEVDVAISFCEANLAADIERTRARTARCKEAAEALYQRALSGILAVRLPIGPTN